MADKAKVTSVTFLQSSQSARVQIGYALPAMVEDLVDAERADVAILSTEEGFSPLGASRGLIERELGVSYEREIKPAAHRAQNTTSPITLVAITSQNQESRLRGVLLIPGEGALCFDSHTRPVGGISQYEYYYRVTREAVRYALFAWKSRRFAVTHLSRSSRFHGEIAKAQVNALWDLCEHDSKSVPDSLIFCGCCIEPNHIGAVRHIDRSAKRSPNVHIAVNEVAISSSMTTLELAWSPDSDQPGNRG